MRPEDHGAFFPVGQFKGLSFWNVLLNRQGTIIMPRNIPPRVHTMSQWLNWVDKYFVVGADGIHLREVPVEHVEHRDLLVTRETGGGNPQIHLCRTKCQERRELQNKVLRVHHQEDLSCVRSFRNDKT